MDGHGIYRTPPRGAAAAGFGTPPRGAAAGFGTPVHKGAAAPPPVRGEEHQPRTIDPELLETKILGLHLEQDEKDAILNKYKHALSANSLLDEYIQIPYGFIKFAQIYAEILHGHRPKSDIKYVLKPAFRASINAQIRAQEEAKRSTGGRRRNYKRTNRNRKQTNRNRKARRQVRTRKN